MRKSLIALLALFLVSCGSTSMDGDEFLPDANGKHGDILLLIEDNLYNSEIGYIVDSMMNLQPPGPYLQPEPMFSYFHKRPDDLNYMNKLNRNILKITYEPDSAYSETRLLIKPNYFAKNQLFLLVKDSDLGRLTSYLENEWLNEIAGRFNDHEMADYERYFNDEPNRSVREMAEKDFGISISLPKDSELRAKRDKFAWVKRDRSHRLTKNEATNSAGGTYWVQQGILFWSEPFDSAAQMSVGGVLQKRDTVLKYNVAGKVPGSYMTTEYDPYFKPVGRKFEQNGSEAIEIRGLWKHAGNRAAFGGGPFVQYTVLNKTQNELVTVCGYIYAPKFAKREYIREIDAMLRSIEVI